MSGAYADRPWGLFPPTVHGKLAVLEYESDRELRDTEQFPLMEMGGLEAFVQREVLPYAPDAWYMPSSVKVGCAISFTRHFSKPQVVRSLNDIRKEIVALDQKTHSLLNDIVYR